ncbi:type VII secretion protein EssB [uncultured Lactobacillus sp.]|uniref:type VII secretion protein EssB n=1 Tax=uncultured Lactobacillus sp. TaxID=153152 RepID=UPI002610C237|nr:type VII secretion protein EssB [uncultured Lactobacillus sp.]
MVVLSDGINQITFEEKRGKANKVSNVIVKLKANQFKESILDQYSLFLGASEHYAGGKIEKKSDSELEINYTLPKQVESLANNLKKFSQLERLQLIQNAFWMFKNDSQVVPFINPHNLYFVGNRIIVVHRGFAEEIAPFKEDNASILKQLRALIIYALEPKQDFEQLVNGGRGLKNTFIQNIEKANTFDQIEAIVEKQIQALVREKRENLVVVRKKRYLSLKWLSIVMSALAGILAVLAIVWGAFVLPKKQNIIDAQSDYMSSNYTKAVEHLEKYQPQDLPKNAKYVLASSYINLDNLSNKQKKAVLKTISPLSANNTLEYWIQIGRGNYQSALSIAKNIGDDQYILHAYTKLYSQTKNNMQMNGAQKQEKLKNYRESINFYLKKLGGKSNEFKGD